MSTLFLYFFYSILISFPQAPLKTFVTIEVARGLNNYFRGSTLLDVIDFR